MQLQLNLLRIVIVIMILALRLTLKGYNIGVSLKEFTREADGTG